MSRVQRLTARLFFCLSSIENAVFFSLRREVKFFFLGPLRGRCTAPG
jgi:hypothetical protein